MTSIVETRQLCFSRGPRAIFDEVTFAIAPGEMVALVGANGIGKTTLLNLIAGLLQSDSGDLLLDNRPLRDWQRREISRFVALVPQQLEVPFSFRVDEIVSQGRVPYLRRFGALSAQDCEVVESAMEAVDITMLRDRVYSELSGGERQRVKIAIGLAQEPRVMLLDEPMQHLDIGRQIEVVNLLKRLNQSGITILAAVHDLSMVGENFERSILLLERKCISGPTIEIMQPELLERAFAVDAAALRSFCEPELAANLAAEAQRDCRHVPERRRRFGRRGSIPIR